MFPDNFVYLALLIIFLSLDVFPSFAFSLIKTQVVHMHLSFKVIVIIKCSLQIHNVGIFVVIN